MTSALLSVSFSESSAFFSLSEKTANRDGTGTPKVDPECGSEIAQRAVKELRHPLEDVPAEDHDRVFSAFYRADRSRTRASGGVGLGLALARRFVDAHGGSIGFTSEPAHGSRFWFELALAPATVDQAA